MGWVVAVMFAAVFALASAAPAIAQQYPPPAPTRNPNAPPKTPKPEKTPKPKTSADAEAACLAARDEGKDGFMTGEAGAAVWTGCGPAVVLGTTLENDGGSGVLPRTGGQILVWLLWAAVFIVLGSALVTGSSYRERFAFLSSLGRGRRSDGEGAEIARIDTSDFVPFRPKAGPDDRSATLR